MIILFYIIILDCEFKNNVSISHSKLCKFLMNKLNFQGMRLHKIEELLNDCSNKLNQRIPIDVLFIYSYI